MKLSDRMIEAGWVIQKERDGSFTVYGSGLQRYRFDSQSQSWSDDLQAIHFSLEQDRANDLSPYITSSRLTALNHTRNISQPMSYLCKNGFVSGKTVLHLGTGMDRFARDEMLRSGALSVADYDPNFFPDTVVLEETYDVVMAHYVVNILPLQERREVYRVIADTLKDGGSAFLTVQGIWPVENKYEIIESLDDGYSIRTGYNRTFRKGYSEEELLREIHAELGGRAEVLTTFYSNTLAAWSRAYGTGQGIEW